MTLLLSTSVVLAVLLLAAAAVLGAAYLFLRRSMPVVRGTLRVQGIHAPVDVIRDANGVPHIVAGERADAYFGLGFVHAQDRLWQMEYQRRLASGRLAEAFGPRAVKADVAMRTLGLRRAAEEGLEHLPGFALDAIRSYVRGVNQAVCAQAGSRRPLECRLMRLAIEPWTPVDVLTCGKLMAWNLAGTYTGDLLRSRMTAQIGADRTAELMSLLDQVASSGGEAPAEAVPIGAAAESFSTAPFEVHVGGSEGMGSNQWVVDGTATATSKPILANDPHLPSGMPGTWYLAHLSAPELDVIGATVPGIPAIVAGRNRSIGWGVASLDVDVQDLFQAGADEPVSERTESIAVRNGRSVEVVVRATAHGPIVSDFMGPEGHAGVAPPLALRWTALDAHDGTLAAFIRLNEARNWDEFSDAFRSYVAPMLLFTYADVEGNIGSRMAGRVPKRSGCDGSAVIAAGSGAEWAGWVPFDEMPSSYNPATHAIVSANTREVDADYPHFLGREQVEPHRRERIRTLLHSGTRLSVDDHAAIQLDTLSTHARRLLPALHPLVQPETTLQRRALELLLAWDYDMGRESAAAAVFGAWWRELPRALAAKTLDPDLLKVYVLWPSYADRFTRRCLQRLTATGTSDAERAACDGIRSAIQQSFADAVAHVQTRLGADPATWRWDRLHRAVFAHTPLNRIPWLRPLVSRTIPMGGDWSSINVGGTWPYEKPFVARYVAGYRQILDLSSVDGGRFIQALGQSGHALSAHYADMAARWQQGGYAPMLMSREGVEGARHTVLRLTPETTAAEEA